jgi:hypothetical protein
MQQTRFSGVSVRVDEARHDRSAAKIDFLCSPGREAPYLFVVSDSEKPSVCDGDGLRARAAIIDCDDVCVVKNQLRFGPVERQRRRQRECAELAEKLTPRLHAHLLAARNIHWQLQLASL